MSKLKAFVESAIYFLQIFLSPLLFPFILCYVCVTMNDYEISAKLQVDSKVKGDIENSFRKKPPIKAAASPVTLKKILTSEAFESQSPLPSPALAGGTSNIKGDKGGTDMSIRDDAEKETFELKVVETKKAMKKAEEEVAEVSANMKAEKDTAEVEAERSMKMVKETTGIDVAKTKNEEEEAAEVDAAMEEAEKGTADLEGQETTKAEIEENARAGKEDVTMEHSFIEDKEKVNLKEDGDAEISNVDNKSIVEKSVYIPDADSRKWEGQEMTDYQGIEQNSIDKIQNGVERDRCDSHVTTDNGTDINTSDQSNAAFELSESTGWPRTPDALARISDMFESLHLFPSPTKKAQYISIIEKDVNIQPFVQNVRGPTIDHLSTMSRGR